jgi:LacI family transcriptional regulator
VRNITTLKKISEHLNMSISTVSRALKDHPDVSSETKKRVKDLAAMMDYEPNAFAVNLRKRHSNVFAVIVPEISNYFYHSFIQSVEEEARRMGFALMILQSMNDPEIEETNLRLCRHNHVAGIFISITDRTTNLKPFNRLDDLDIPTVFFDKVPAEGAYNRVSVADYETGEQVASILLGARSGPVLAIMGHPSLSITQRREAGLRDALQKQAPDVDLVVHYTTMIEEARSVVTNYYKKAQPPYTRVFCMSDEILCGVQKALNELNLVPPRDLALLTISNGFIPLLFSPVISFVKTSGYDLGKLSFSRMMEIFNGKKFVRENFLSSTYHPGGTL